MRTSVIIPSLNAPTLARALAAVMAQTEPPAEVIVVGRDEAGALAAFPAGRLLDTGAPVCPALARNLGPAAATGVRGARLKVGYTTHPRVQGAVTL